MAGLRVFVSSTCYDLSLLRSQLRVFIQSLGYEPIMSDYEEVLYDPREHTHTSCVDEVANCDILVLIIGSRLGGKALTETLEKIDFEKLKKDNKRVEQLKQNGNLSITQLEVLKAIENGIPVYTFIEKKVWHDHELYEKNKNVEIIDKIIFPSIEKQEAAKYIFEFINFVRLRAIGNNVFPFEKETDIEEILKKQWSGYFQRLLQEQRDVKEERKKMEQLTDQFEDLKTAILSSIVNVDQREVARGIVKYRRLFTFVFSLKNITQTYLKTTKECWESVLKTADIVKIIDPVEEHIEYPSRVRLLLICSDETFYEVRFGREFIDGLGDEWASFLTMSDQSRAIIVETLGDMDNRNPYIRYYRESVKEVTDRWKSRNVRHTEMRELLEISNGTEE